MKKLSDIKEAAQKFVNKWKNRGGEIQDSQTFIDAPLLKIYWKMFLALMTPDIK